MPRIATTVLPLGCPHRWGDRTDFHCVLVSLTALPGVHSLLQTCTHGRFTMTKDWMSISKRFGFPSFEIYWKITTFLRLLFLRRGNTHHAHQCSVKKAQISCRPSDICLKAWVLKIKDIQVMKAKRWAFWILAFYFLQALLFHLMIPLPPIFIYCLYIWPCLYYPA